MFITVKRVTTEPFCRKSLLNVLETAEEGLICSGQVNRGDKRFLPHMELLSKCKVLLF